MNNEKPVNLIPRDIGEIRIAIAGMGKMGSVHLDSLQQLAAGRHEDYYKGKVQTQLNKIYICGLCDIDPTRLAQHDSIKGFNDFAEMLKVTKPDIVIIATPTDTHFDFASTALQKGIHTLVEKPIVTTEDKINRLVDIAEETGCRLIAGHVERYNPVSIKIVSLLQSRFKPDSYSFVRTQQHDKRIAEDIITDKVVHDIDLALYFFGPIADVNVKETKKVNGQAYEASLEILHENNIKGTIFVSWLLDSAEKKRQVEILCSEHKLLGDFANKQLLVDGQGVECEVPGMIKPENNQIKDELVDFVMYCSQPEPSQKKVLPLLSFDEIVQSINWIDQITKACYR